MLPYYSFNRPCIFQNINSKPRTASSNKNTSKENPGILNDLILHQTTMEKHSSPKTPSEMFTHCRKEKRGCFKEAKMLLSQHVYDVLLPQNLEFPFLFSLNGTFDYNQYCFFVILSQMYGFIRFANHCIHVRNISESGLLSRGHIRLSHSDT